METTGARQSSLGPFISIGTNRTESSTARATTLHAAASPSLMAVRKGRTLQPSAWGLSQNLVTVRCWGISSISTSSNSWLSEKDTHDFHVTLEQAEDEWIVVECPALPGCVSQGKDEEEALENIGEAMTAWLWAGS